MDLDEYLAQARAGFGPGPLALIFAEDGAALRETVTHHLQLGFAHVFVLAPPTLPVPDMPDEVTCLAFDPAPEGSVAQAVTRIGQTVAEGTWIYYGFNAEFLFFPFCDSRSVGEMLRFHAEERREAMVCFVTDLYPGDLEAAPEGICFETTHLDSAGYYALAREDAENGWRPKERQMDFFGGLRWRFEEHVPFEQRRIDRVAVFRAGRGRVVLPDHRLNEEELNTYACPWHNNLTAAVASFRAAKALRINPASRKAIAEFRWTKSVPFGWTPQELLDLGLMETGQWF